MARKEEEKKKEISKLAVLKVLHVLDRCCLPDLATQKNDENEILGRFSTKRIPLLICPSISIPSERFCAGTLEKSYFIYKTTCLACRRFWLKVSAISFADKTCHLHSHFHFCVSKRCKHCHHLIPASILSRSVDYYTANSSLAVSRKVCLHIFYFFIKFRKNVVLLSTMHSGSGKYHESKKGMRIITTSSPMHLFKLVTWNIKILLVLVSVQTVPDSYCAGTKIIPDKASVHTPEWLWRRDFCEGSVTYRIGFVLYFDARPVAEVNRDLKIRRRRRQRERHKSNRFN